jgi:hypothetical protein
MEWKFNILVDLFHKSEWVSGWIRVYKFKAEHINTIVVVYTLW